MPSGSHPCFQGPGPHIFCERRGSRGGRPRAGSRQPGWLIAQAPLPRLRNQPGARSSQAGAPGLPVEACVWSVYGRGDPGNSPLVVVCPPQCLHTQVTATGHSPGGPAQVCMRSEDLSPASCTPMPTSCARRRSRSSPPGLSKSSVIQLQEVEPGPALSFVAASLRPVLAAQSSCLLPRDSDARAGQTPDATVALLTFKVPERTHFSTTESSRTGDGLSACPVFLMEKEPTETPSRFSRSRDPWRAQGFSNGVCGQLTAGKRNPTAELFYWNKDAGTAGGRGAVQTAPHGQGPSCLAPHTSRSPPLGSPPTTPAPLGPALLIWTMHVPRDALRRSHVLSCPHHVTNGLYPWREVPGRGWPASSEVGCPACPRLSQGPPARAHGRCPPQPLPPTAAALGTHTDAGWSSGTTRHPVPLPLGGRREEGGQVQVLRATGDSRLKGLRVKVEWGQGQSHLWAGGRPDPWDSLCPGSLPPSGSHAGSAGPASCP